MNTKANNSNGYSYDGFNQEALLLLSEVSLIGTNLPGVVTSPSGRMSMWLAHDSVVGWLPLANVKGTVYMKENSDKAPKHICISDFGNLERE